MNVARSPASPMPHWVWRSGCCCPLAREGGRRLAGIARLALAINRTRGPDCSGEQLCGVTAGRAEIEGDDTGTNADEAQHLLRLATQIVGTVGRAAIRASHDLRNLLRSEVRRTLLRRRYGGVQEQDSADSDCSQEVFSTDFHRIALCLFLPTGPA